MLQRSIIWEPWFEAGLEKLNLDVSEEEIVAVGELVRLGDGRPWQGRYLIVCDPSWRVRSLDIDLGNAGSLSLRSDGGGHWSDGVGRPLPEIEGCFDVDISATPFTNTLAMRRLALPVGGEADLVVAHVRLPELGVRKVPQRYVRLADTLWRYEALFRDFTAELQVDADGLILDYPETFRRVRPG